MPIQPLSDTYKDFKVNPVRQWVYHDEPKGSVLGAAMRLYNPVFSFKDSILNISHLFDFGYDPWNDIPEELKGTPFASSFVFASSPEDVSRISGNIYQELQDRDLLDHAGLKGFVSTMIAGATDPVQYLIPGSMLFKATKGAGVLRTAGKFALGGMISNIPTEIALQAGVVTRTWQESAIDTMAVGVLSSIIGAGHGFFNGKFWKEYVDNFESILRGFEKENIDLPKFKQDYIDLMISKSNKQLPKEMIDIAIPALKQRGMIEGSALEGLLDPKTLVDSEALLGDLATLPRQSYDLIEYQGKTAQTARRYQPWNTVLSFPDPIVPKKDQRWLSRLLPWKDSDPPVHFNAELRKSIQGATIKRINQIETLIDEQIGKFQQASTDALLTLDKRKRAGAIRRAKNASRKIADLEKQITTELDQARLTEGFDDLLNYVKVERDGYQYYIPRDIIEASPKIQTLDGVHEPLEEKIPLLIWDKMDEFNKIKSIGDALKLRMVFSDELIQSGFSQIGGTFIESENLIKSIYSSTTLAHEIGHAIDKKAGILKKIDAIDEKELKEAFSLGLEDRVNTLYSYMAGRSKNERVVLRPGRKAFERLKEAMKQSMQKYYSPEEGLADIISLYLLDKERARLIAPKFFHKFESKINDLINGINVENTPLTYLKNHIEYYRKNNPTYIFDESALKGSDIYGACEECSIALVDDLQRHGYQADVVYLEGFKKKLGTDSGMLPDEVGKHAMAMVDLNGETVFVDLTGRQFGKEFGGTRYLTVDELMGEWDKATMDFMGSHPLFDNAPKATKAIEPEGIWTSAPGRTKVFISSLYESLPKGTFESLDAFKKWLMADPKRRGTISKVDLKGDIKGKQREIYNQSITKHLGEDLAVVNLEELQSLGEIRK